MKRTNIGFYVLIFTTLTVSLTIITFLYKAFPLFSSKALFLCQKFISEMMLQIPSSLPNTFILVLAGVLIVGILSFMLQLIKTHLFLRKLLLNKVGISRDLIATLKKLNLKDKVILVYNKNLISFCCGLFSPYIIISTGLVKSLKNKELEAVLLHEQSHLISKDPIKVLIGKTFSSMFFFLPIFKELYKNIEAANELLADQWAITNQQKSTYLRGALKKILSEPQLNYAAISGASHPDYLEIRIRRIINPEIKHKFRLSLISLFTFFLFTFASWLLLQTPVSAFHMHSQPDSVYLLCFEDPSCLKQCHQDSEQTTTYIPSHLNLEETKCDNPPRDINYSTPLF